MRGCGSRESTPPNSSSSLKLPRYEAKFYEWQALCHVAHCLGNPVLTNVRALRPNTGHFQSPEVDGVVEIAGKRILVEAKSYGLTQGDVGKIVEKYKTISWDELLLVAPLFHQPEFNRPASVRLLPFTPNLSPLRRIYFASPYSLPSALQEELASGDHNFRYISAYRRRGEGATFRNQVDKRIKSVSALLRDIQRQNRTGDLPVRVFWSVSRWLFPKELFFSSYPNHFIRRGLVFDIDGSAIHNRSSPCEILPGRTICMLCVNAAKDAALRLVEFLSARGLSNIQAVFSGRQGFHVYVLNSLLDEPEVVWLVHAIADAGIPIDAKFTLDRKSVVTFPGSIHGLSMLRALPVDNLETFSVEHLIDGTFAPQD
jgi:hypothetical protein